MKLAAHIDTSYLHVPRAKIQAGRKLFLSKDTTVTQNNGAVLNIAPIIKRVMTSATEAELTALYLIEREALYPRIILVEIGHKQWSPHHSKLTTQWQMQ